MLNKELNTVKLHDTMIVIVIPFVFQVYLDSYQTSFENIEAVFLSVLFSKDLSTSAMFREPSIQKKVSSD